MKSLNGKPIPFIEIGEDGCFSVSAYAMTALEKHQSRNVAVVSVTGPENTGKSFLCNRILGQMKGFELGGYSRDGTRGIWMWSELIPLNDKDGIDTGIDLLLIDTEGLHNQKLRGFDDDVKTFALTILLSSVLVYNQIGHISDQALENLSLV